MQKEQKCCKRAVAGTAVRTAVLSVCAVWGTSVLIAKGLPERLCNARSTFGNLVCLASSVTVYFTMITKYLLTLQNSWGLLIRSTYWF